MSSGPLYLPATFDSMPHVAVCAGRSGRLVHAGIIFRSNDGPRLMLDIDLNGSITADTIPNKSAGLYAWAIPDFPELALRNFAAYCDFLASKAPNVGYAFKVTQSTALVANGHDVTLTDATGLTCATFVLIAFRSNFMDLVNLETWVHRDEDEEFQRIALEHMRRRVHDPRYYGITQERVDHAASQIPALRCRPEEVLGACRVGNHPSEMTPCAAAGAESLQWIDETIRRLA